ncbi:hypothetical protein GBAR_LOCUS12820 [Geodia barretti]|uniref:Uncharacterized protein n=1 Tax=Geodia barretti TaxID=519541 RepID=A0AA35S1D8_GEOBA|nr:hypothetical protein GBAR_LOCUS12820 [Geodia barretti]
MLYVRALPWGHRGQPYQTYCHKWSTYSMYVCHAGSQEPTAIGDPGIGDHGISPKTPRLKES